MALEQRLSKLEGDRRTAERLLGIAAVVLVGIENGQRNRDGIVGSRKMVVGDDEVEAEALRGFCFGKGAHSGVDSDDETNTLGIGGFEYGGLQSVALAQSMGHMEANLAAEQFNCGLKQDDGGGAVHVIVTVEQDGFLARDGCFDALHGRLHAEHKERIVELCNFRIEERESFAGGGDAASDQEFGQYGGNPCSFGERQASCG